MRKHTFQLLACTFPLALFPTALAGCAGASAPATSASASGAVERGTPDRSPATGESRRSASSHLADAQPETDASFSAGARELFQPLVMKETRTPSRRAGEEHSRQGALAPVPESTFRQPEEIPQVGEGDGDADEDRPILRGVMRQGNSVRAVIEDPEAKITRTVRAGERVFGYEVVEIANESAVLRGEGETLALTLDPGEAPALIEPLSDGLGLADPRNSALAGLPSHLALTLSRVLPKEGELVRVRPDTDDGIRLWRVEKRINGMSHEVRIAEDGRILRVEARLKLEDVPKAVTAAAEKAVEGYVINPSDTPRYWDRNGRKYYEIEVMRPGTRDEIDLQIAPDGSVIGRD